MEKTGGKWKFDKMMVLDRDRDALWELGLYIDQSAEVSEVIFFCLSDVDLVLKDLEKITELPQVPDLIIFNVIMPTEDCLYFAERFDALPDLIRHNCKIILISAFFSNFNYDDNLCDVLQYPFIMGILESPMNQLKFDDILGKYSYEKPKV